MRLLGLAAAIISFAAMTAAVQAAPGFATADVNSRTGPDIEFPSAGIIPEGAPIDVQGCLNDESWCDVIWKGNRGWVFSEYLGFDYRGQIVLLPDAGPAVFSIPVVVFSTAEYWGRYYVGRSWYGIVIGGWYQIHPRVGWRTPPPGPRKAGWWRSGYRAPGGMKPPPERWRRQEHHEHHEHREHRQ